MIRVLLAEDHETVREGLRLVVNAQPDMQVVAEAGDGQGVVESAAVFRPDVIVLDLSLRGMGGLEAARALKRSGAPSAIVALTRHGDGAFVQELLDAGAAAYVLKQSASAELVHAIRTAASGGRYLDPALPRREEADDPRRRQTTPRATDREIEVLHLIALGRTDVVRYAVLNGWFTEP